MNPNATSTTRLRRDVIASALASAVELKVVQTRYRGQATSLAAAAVSSGYGLVITLGGDGTVNEAVNGLVSAGERDGRARPAAELPALAPLPGGNANVFTHTLGLPSDPVDATGEILRALAANRERSIGLGLAGSRYFTFNAGLGLDAEVVRAVEGSRAGGHAATPALYLRMAARQFYRVTDRRHPPLTMELTGRPPTRRLFLGIVSNTAPWTYLGNRAVHTNPQAGFDSGLDVLALGTLNTRALLTAGRQMLFGNGQPLHGRGILALHDESELSFRSDRPVAFQVDGEYVGEVETVRFRSIPRALRVIA